MSAGLRTAPATGARAERSTNPDPTRWGRMRGWLRMRRSQGRPRRTLLTGLALVALLAAGVIFLFFFSSAFVVKDLEVSGGRAEVQESAVSLAQIPSGRPLARVAEGAVGERVLADPRIAEISVERDWPSTVRLVLAEREPVLALSDGDATWLADADGVVYEQVEQASNKLPLFQTGGDPTELDRPTVAGLAQLWRMRPDPDVLKGDLGRPRVAADGVVTMRVGEVRLLWGPPEQNEKKWQVVTAIVGQDAVDPQGDTRIDIDVRTPDTPVVTGLPPAPTD
ncbi:cell division protein FtsQ/DivIB [Ornithinimicrobium pratense]|uniref:FtsQ-type POTRA domain-containing protein n=1 Tax=Ornithinimicrobium pratense TaxID=2593973 RepID=A0A5J6V4Z3_9MICO|nr:FtsQ-type POTRA domain-containing protein [Ornithinimicrobium pratense]QFG68142.1 FtsQ-type POTRA domain-containing protein [Ornithinimicrobium pratense]